MSNPVGQYILKDMQTGEPMVAFLYEGIEERHLKDVDGKWKPLILRKVEEYKLSDYTQLGSLHLEDFSWDWRKKLDATSGSLVYRSFALECEANTQGLMMIDLSKRCRLGTQNNQHLAYIKFLSTAPWNRSPLMVPEPAQYRGVGTAMIATAIQVSYEEGFCGRIGLHALPQAENFYLSSIGMMNLGKDQEYENLKYFEMTPEEAETFIERGK